MKNGGQNYGMLEGRLFTAVLFFLWLPLVCIVVMAFVRNDGLNPGFSLAGFDELFTRLRFFEILNISKRALIVCGLSTALGFIIAYLLANYTSRLFQISFLIAITLPFLANEAVRVFSWQSILSENGLLNRLLSVVVRRPVVVFSASNGWNIYFAMIVACIPFGIFICMAALRTIPSIYWTAAHDLNLKPLLRLIKIAIPLSRFALLASLIVTFFVAFSLSAEVNHLGGDTKISTRNLVLSLMSASRFQAIFALGFFILLLLFATAFLLRLTTGTKTNV